MASIINATTTAGVSVQGDNSGELQLQTNSGTTAVTIDTSQNVTFAKPITVGGNTLGAGNASSFKNRIINGSMTIDQRNAGASVTPTSSAYTLDRWDARMTQSSKYSIQQDAGAVTPPTGFTDYLGVTSLSAYSVLTTDTFAIAQSIEGFNTADLGWGTANAKTVTLSFWVRSSLTGTFGGSFRNSAVNRSYPFTYTISAANTWEQKTVTVAGDTSGTWLTTNGIGIALSIGLGAGSTFSGTAGAWAGSNFTNATGATSVVGTNGATFYITGVQLEVGSTATSFDYRPYGTELALCQRYYYKTSSPDASTYGSGIQYTTSVAILSLNFPVTMRTTPTALEQSGTAGHYYILDAGAVRTCTSVPSFNGASTNSAQSTFTASGSLTAGRAALGGSLSASSYLAWSSEL